MPLEFPTPSSNPEITNHQARSVAGAPVVQHARYPFLPFNIPGNATAIEQTQASSGGTERVIRHGRSSASNPAADARAWQPSLPRTFEFDPAPRPTPNLMGSDIGALYQDLPLPFMFTVSETLQYSDPVLIHMAQWLHTLSPTDRQDVLAQAQGLPDALVCRWLNNDHPLVKGLVEHLADHLFAELKGHPQDVCGGYIRRSKEDGVMTREELVQLAMPGTDKLYTMFRQVLDVAFSGSECRSRKLDKPAWLDRLAERLVDDHAARSLSAGLEKRLRGARDEAHLLAKQAKQLAGDTPPAKPL